MPKAKTNRDAEWYTIYVAARLTDRLERAFVPRGTTLGGFLSAAEPYLDLKGKEVRVGSDHKVSRSYLLQDGDIVLVLPRRITAVEG